MDKLLNRRHVYLEKGSLERMPQVIEEVDNYIQFSKTLELSSEKIIIYGEGLEIFKIGREVVGHDTDLAHHERLLCCDYPGQSILRKLSFNLKSYQELMEQISKELESFEQEKVLACSGFRVSFMNYDSFEVIFFKREK